MKCLREVAVISRHHARPASLASTARRNASSKHGKPYELTPLVMDLDAADNTQIRQIKEISEEPWKGSERLQNRIAKLTEIETAKRSRLEKRRELRRQLSFNTLVITPPDLMQFALLGDPYKQSADQVPTGYLKGISTYLELHKKDPERLKLWSFIKNLPADGETALKQAGFGSSEVINEAILQQMKDKPLFKRLRRTINILSQTEEGCKFLLSNMKDLKYILEKSTKDVPQYSNVLIMLNNLVASIHSKGLQIGPILCNMGLYYASRANSHSAVQKYLDIAIQNSYRPNYPTRTAILRLAVPKTPLATPKPWVEGEDYMKQDILTLLTGWESNGVPSSLNEVQQPCFARLVTKDHSSRPLYLAYIQALAELGATDALWHEFKHIQSLPSSIMINTHRLHEAFMTAFLIAKDTNSATEVIPQAKASGIDLSNTSTTASQSPLDIDEQQQSHTHPTNPAKPEDPVITSLLLSHIEVWRKRSALRNKNESGQRQANVNSSNPTTVLHDIENIQYPKEKVHAIEEFLSSLT
ncbi:hypothetical protein B7463_g5266, partial [Scytalidium lignicola]